jgi:uncharacterized phage-associated protein
MHSVFEVADFFVDLAIKGAGDLISPLKINKLLYYAQGNFLAKYNAPLFPEKIQAWQYGPVIPEIYHKYKVLGRQPIEIVDEDYNASIFTPEETTFLLDIAREYGKYSAETLVTKTHSEDPWKSAFNGSQNTIISDASMQEYFRKHPVKNFSNVLHERIASTTPQHTFPQYYFDPNEDILWDER